jgi:hypothetical protein
MRFPRTGIGVVTAGQDRQWRMLAVLLAAAVVAAVAANRMGQDAARAGASANPVQVENTRPGTRQWRIRLTPQHALEGYASEVSVAPGQALHLHVSTALRLRYRVRVFRIGWYDGNGGRLMPCATCRVHRASSELIPHPDQKTGLLRLAWPVTDVVRIGRSWVSGYYIAELVVRSGPLAGRGSWVPFVVRELRSRRSAILVQAAVNTWQAYNTWGGRSLYWNHTGIGDNRVSFNRPYTMSGAPPEGGPGANLPSAWEFPLARFLERYGYDVSYTTDVDTDRNPAELLRHRLVMTAGHDEYWTKTMRDAFEAARAGGVNLAFMGANTGYWQMRYENGRRTIVEYRTADQDPETDPALKTITFRELGRPECKLLGVQWGEIGNADYTAVGAGIAPKDPWFVGTGLTRSDLLPDLVGYEYDTLFTNCEQPGTTILFEARPRNHLDADAVRYTAPSGSVVFSSGSIRFATRLDDITGRGDPRLQRFLRNALVSLLR